MTDDRAALRRLIGENHSLLANNLHVVFADTIEALIAGGQDPRDVANAALYVVASWQQRIHGTAAWIERLRDFADLYERRLMANVDAKNSH